MSADGAKIADEFLTALRCGSADYGQALARRWSDQTVDLRHEPPLPMDGMKTREQMLGHRSILDEVFNALMEDFHYAGEDVKVVGDVIFIFYEQRGTLANGIVLNSPICTRLNIRDGRIERVLLTIDAEANAALTEAFDSHVQALGLGSEI